MQSREFGSADNSILLFTPAVIRIYRLYLISLVCLVNFGVYAGLEALPVAVVGLVVAVDLDPR